MSQAMELTTEGYEMFIRSHKNMRVCATELSLLIWPRYPESLAAVPVAQLLRWIHSIRVGRINKILATVEVHRSGACLADLEEWQRELLANVLSDIGNGVS